MLDVSYVRSFFGLDENIFMGFLRAREVLFYSRSQASLTAPEMNGLRSQFYFRLGLAEPKRGNSDREREKDGSEQETHLERERIQENRG